MTEVNYQGNVKDRENKVGEDKKSSKILLRKD